MFDVGDEVVCIDDKPTKKWRCGKFVGLEEMPFKKGDHFKVLESHPPGSKHSRGGLWMTCEPAAIGIGLTDDAGFDVWVAFRFRKVIKLDTQESLSELIKLADTAPAKPETVDA